MSQKLHDRDHVSKRLEEAFISFIKKDYVGSLLNFFTALDNTSALRRPEFAGKRFVGRRIQAFVSDYEDLITKMALGNTFIGLNIDGWTLPRVIYELARNPITHEGKLDDRLEINETGQFSISATSWNISTNILFALLMTVVLAEENKGLKFSKDLNLIINGEKRTINELWGHEAEIRAKLMP
ncbi:hypothetical protein ACR0X1_002252 [Enterobacter hormaechei]